MKYSVSLGYPENFSHTFTSELEYNAAIKRYTENGFVQVSGRLIEKHHKPTWIGEEYKPRIVSLVQGVFEGTPEPTEQTFNLNVLRLNTALTLLGYTFTFWHYKAAKIATASSEYETLKSFLIGLEDGDRAQLDKDAAEILKKSVEPMPYNQKTKCNKCYNGWVTNHLKKTARPCGCDISVVSKFTEYATTHAF